MCQMKKKNILKNLKAAALNNKSNNLALTDLEGSLNIINKAIEIEPTEKLEMLKKNRLERFKKYLCKKFWIKN